eukprot:CAMPEP_0179049566 /NCGR_PEP_ID=MMETSP0796-20121207/20279_1 /TAXON_ID=73915 /ORGANISM="Pyrodinium bahamense, Strain pbaha01" /LENGTH=373 /DNA_ID=CAMNT_0020746047 /DNA_START=148 /DNA_END=1269 /DNA_ORIENTATION=+
MLSGLAARTLMCLIGAMIGMSLAISATSFTPFCIHGRSHRCGPGQVAASALRRSSSTAFSLQGPPLDIFDGIEDIEEEEEDEPEGQEEYDEGGNGAITLVPKGSIGDGITQLQSLAEEYERTGTDPNLDAEAIGNLHALLAEDAPKCPSVATVAWIVRTLEELAIEEDEILEILGDIITNRADELEPQSLLDTICSYGNVYWAGDDTLLDALANAVRRQLDDFTPAEIVRLANGLTRMGGTDDTRHAGLFFEMRQRVNLPHIDKFIKDAMNRDAQVYREKSETTLRALKALDGMPSNSKLKAKAEKHLQWEIETNLPRLLEQAHAEETLHDGWESIATDMNMFSGRDDASEQTNEDDGPPAVRFQDLAASEAS